MEKIDLPDGGKYRVEDANENKVRIFYDGSIDGLRLRDNVVKTPRVNLSELSEDGITQLVNSMVHEDHKCACPHCDEVRTFSEMRRYGFAGTVCNTCWEQCVCRNCDSDDWEHTSSRSTRKSNTKQCPHCGKKFVTQVATG